MTLSRTPRQKAKITAVRLLIYGAVITLLAIASEFLPLFILPASILAIILHEVMIWLAQREEDNYSPLYVHSEKGIEGVGVLPNSAAKLMGIQAGEIIHKVNRQLVRTKKSCIKRFVAIRRLRVWKSSIFAGSIVLPNRHYSKANTIN